MQKTKEGGQEILKEEMNKIRGNGQEKLKVEIQAERAGYRRSMGKSKEELKIEETQLKADTEENVIQKIQEVREQMSATRQEIKAAQEDLNIEQDEMKTGGENSKRELERKGEVLPGEDK